jgi:hypothetical protein
LRKIQVAIQRSTEQLEAFKLFSSVLDPEQVTEWLSEMTAWEEDPSSTPNPFRNRMQGLTQADVCLALAQEDQQNLKKHTESVQSDVSPSMMINMGIELEDQQ